MDCRKTLLEQLPMESKSQLCVSHLIIATASGTHAHSNLHWSELVALKLVVIFCVFFPCEVIQTPPGGTCSVHQSPNLGEIRPC